MRVALIANEASGSAGTAGEVAARLRAADVEVVPVALDEFCGGPDRLDAERLAQVAERLGARSGAVDRIVAAGGDGTLGPAGLLALRAAVPLAVVPVGTANSFARWLGLPLDAGQAVRLAATEDAITQTVEVASADGRPFVNVASTGLAVLAADHARPLKPRLGAFAYAAGAARAGVSGKPITTAVTTDGKRAWDGAAWQIAIAATGAFGGDSATGGVDPRDEQLDVAIVEAGPRRRLVRYAYAMRRGRLVREDDVPHVRGRVVELDVPAGTEFNVDGELLMLESARFEVLGTIEVVTGPATAGPKGAAILPEAA